MTRSKTIRFLLLAFSVLILLSCNFRPDALKGLFASATPTPTDTPTATVTPSVTPTSTATPTPLPAINLTPCAYLRYCPEASSIASFIDEELPDGEEYYVEIPPETDTYFSIGWVAKDEAALAENIKHIHFFFEIDGQSYYDERFTAQDVAYTVDNPDPGYPSIFTGIITSGWKIGEPHQIRIGYEFDAEIFDGWDTYPAGTRYEYTYLVMPVILPTVTPTPSPMPIPTAVPYTPTPACDRSASIKIINDTGAQLTIYMKGPASFTFYVASGEQMISVCPGTYSYTAYGCGGASRTGSASDGDEIEFWCE